MTSAARHPRNIVVVAMAALLAALAVTVTPTADAGLIGTGTASGCDAPSKVFAPWGDYSNYLLVPGGAFEAGMPAWSLSGGARIVNGNEPFYVRSRSDSRSLSLPSGSSALSPTVCFGLGDWHARFFVRSVGTAQGSLKVDIVVKSLVGGLVSILDGGSITAGGAWSPSPRIRLTLTNVCSLLGVKAVAFRFRAAGSGAAFQVDDVYLDPFKDW